MSLIGEYKLCETWGLVLAVNARLLSKNMAPFEVFLDAYPEAQLLCWVGSGEPKIAKRKVTRIQRHFQRHGSEERVGFDVQVRDKYSFFVDHKIQRSPLMLSICISILCS